MSHLSKTWKRKHILLARLFQEELGRLPCAFVKYMYQQTQFGAVLTVWQASHKQIHKSSSESPSIAFKEQHIQVSYRIRNLLQPFSNIPVYGVSETGLSSISQKTRPSLNTSSRLRRRRHSKVGTEMGTKQDYYLEQERTRWHEEGMQVGKRGP